MTTSPYDSLPVGNNDTLPKPGPQPASEISKPGPQPTKPAPAVKLTPFHKEVQYNTLNIKNLNGVCEYILPFEESLLVPDTMPDMAKVLFAEGRVDLALPGKLCYDRNDFLAGDMTVYTVYVPVTDTESPVDVVKSSFPFKTDKCWDAASGNDFRVSISIKQISAEMINERKFIVRGELLIKMTDISHKSLKVFKSAEDEQLITATDVINATSLVSELTDMTEISQDITIRDDLPSPIKIIKESFDITETHRQITSGKLVINAVINSQILYFGELSDGNRRLACITSKTDFTQFIVMDEHKDPDMMEIEFLSKGLKATIENKDKLNLEGTVISHIYVYENQEIPVVTDAYHKAQDISFDATILPLTILSSVISGEISSREVLDMMEANDKPSILLSGDCRISMLEGHLETDRIIIEGSVPVTILALDEDDKPFTIEHSVPIRGALAFSSENTLSAVTVPQIYLKASVREFWFNEINSRQIEINLRLAISLRTSEEKNFCSLENLCFAETDTPQKHKSMAIYVVERGDTLWDVAKRYKTDLTALAALNEIDPSSPLPVGAKLFISK